MIENVGKAIPLCNDDPLLSMSQGELEDVIFSWPVDKPVADVAAKQAGVRRRRRDPFAGLLTP